MYVHSFSDRHTFLTGEEQLNITGYDTEKDLQDARQFMKQKDTTFDKNFLSRNKINYLYIRPAELETPIKVKEDNLTKVFRNDEVVIYQYEQN